MLSGLLLLRIVVENKIIAFYSIVFIVILIGLELGQLFSIRAVTFDWLDFVAIVIFQVLAYS